MKLFFCETYDDGTLGGSHSCMYALIRHSNRAVIKFTVGFCSENIYTPRYREMGVDVNILPFVQPLKNGNVILRKGMNWYNLEYKAGKYLEDYFRREGFDLVVLNNSVYASLLFIRVCKKLHIPVIVYERGIGQFKKKHIQATASINASIPISDAVDQCLRNQNFRSDIIERIYDGIDPDSMIAERKPEMIKEDLKIPLDSRVIGIIGNIRPWKGHKYFIEGFVRLAKQYENLWGLVIGGWGEEDKGTYSYLKDMVNKACLKDRLIFLGYRTDIPDLMSIMDIFVHASIKPEPFGMVILEAMAARRPVIATNIGGPVEILNHGECGLLIPPKDGMAIADACIRYLNDHSFTRKIVQMAYDRLVQHFHIRHTVDTTMRLYSRVLLQQIEANTIFNS